MFFLGLVYGVFMIVRLLRYLINKVYGVYRWGNGFFDWLVCYVIRCEFNGLGKLVGYCFMI